MQGPDDLERQGFIDLPKEDQDAYFGMHKLTVPERKSLEEGETNLQNANEWGYYDNPDDIDALIGWLDERGRREKELRKELTLWREDIVRQMERLKEHLKERNEEPDSEDEQAIRVSTRHKTYVNVEALGQTCLKWHNTTAIENHNHIHSEQPRPKEKKAKHDPKRESKGVARVSTGKVAAAKPAPRQTRSGKL